MTHCGHSSVHHAQQSPHPMSCSAPPPTGWGRPEDPVQRKSDDKWLPGRDNPLFKHACCSNYKGDQIGFKLELIGCPLIHAIYLALTSPSGRVGWKKTESHLLPHCTHVPEGNSCKPPAPNPFQRFKEHRQWELGAWGPPLPTSPEEDERGLGGSGRPGVGDQAWRKQTGLGQPWMCAGVL